MKIAATYENGEIFQHFGKTDAFKVYEVEDGKIVSSEVFSTDGKGHSALAGLLAEHAIDVLICGGIGGGAQTALGEVGIEVCAGAQGNTDAAVEAYLRGELVSAGVTCDHHGEDHECSEHGCGEHEEGHACGGCAGCGPNIEGPNVGKICKVHYIGSYKDGTQFDSSYERGEPLEFVCGVGMMIRGFDTAVATMQVGTAIDVHLMPEDAYGEKDPESIFSAEISRLPGAEDLDIGEQIYLYNSAKQSVPVVVVAKDEKTITFDANHPLAGEELDFKIELLEVRDM